MYKILKREDLVPNIHLFEVEAPAVARKAQPGQFVVIRIDETGERIPVTVADFDRDRGTLTTKRQSHDTRCRVNGQSRLVKTPRYCRLGVTTCAAAFYMRCLYLPICRHIPCGPVCHATSCLLNAIIRNLPCLIICCSLWGLPLC